ncbi:unnamed protein product [Brassica rapa]|uniref:RNase H type-1 domain-containing protein n=1 Tax=Brassica campestris TaxID=3711 RepID=A0A8D9GY17_BRACM|nr:unnamed protein product [Brassica rapa]
MRLVQLALEETHLWVKVNKRRDDLEWRRLARSQAERWSPPVNGSIKCNVHANWRNSMLHCGAAWIARDSSSLVKFHAREAFTCSESKLIAELRCIIWVLHSVRDLHFDQICIASDHKDTIAAISSPNQWPRYRFLLEEINHLSQSFSMVSFKEENISANLIVRDIAKSVLRDGRFQSYLAMGGPAWLPERLHREATYNS